MHTPSTPLHERAQTRLAPPPLPPGVEAAIDRHQRLSQPRLKRLWDYYRNPMEQSHLAAASAWRIGAQSGKGYRLAQERGLPARLTSGDSRSDDRAWARKEIVVENDIGWRIQTMVDFMFGRPVAIASNAHDATVRRRIERILDAVWEASGGISLLQDIALLGNIYGYVDLVVRRIGSGASETDGQDDDALAAAAAETVRIEVVEPTRGVAVFSPSDHRELTAYVIRAARPANQDEQERSKPALPAGSGLARWLGLEDKNARLLGGGGSDHEMVQVTEVLTPEGTLVYEQHGTKMNVLAEDDNAVSFGEVPVVHIQNISQPFCYEGLSEVEPLVPLQDELNTRLSDRACRVTFQSFKMFLAKGLEGMDKAPFGPGQVWQTDNPDARVEAIGGDAASPSEDKHIEEIREAMDKTSGVPPLAAGVVRAKIGNLTSENALRVTLMGLLSKTARKRVTYGRGIAEASRLVLAALDSAGILSTEPEQRRVRVDWPDPLPRNEQDLLNAAEKKIALGVSRERVLSELGYSASDPGVV